MPFFPSPTLCGLGLQPLFSWSLMPVEHRSSFWFAGDVPHPFSPPAHTYAREARINNASGISALIRKGKTFKSAAMQAGAAPGCVLRVIMRAWGSPPLERTLWVRLACVTFWPIFRVVAPWVLSSPPVCSPSPAVTEAWITQSGCCFWACLTAQWEPPPGLAADLVCSSSLPRSQ